MRIASREVMLINQRAMLRRNRGSVYLNYFREEIVVVVVVVVAQKQ